MPVTVAITRVSPNPVANQTLNFTVTVSNSGSSALTLNSLSINEQSDTGAQISQPNYLTPNVPVGVGNPTISGGGSVTYGFQMVCSDPYAAGPSPNNPGGASPAPAASPIGNPFITLQAIGQTSDGSVFSVSTLVPVLSAIAPFPLPQGGALQFNQGANLITLTMLGAL